MSSRFLVPPEQIHNQKFIILGSEARHAAVVLRMKPGDAIEIFDGKDLSYQGKIESVAVDRIEGVIVSRLASSTSPTVHLTLYQALIKGPKWDWLVEKACEIGVTTLVPIMTTRTVVKPSGENAVQRSKRIALAAAKQCGRSRVMEITAPKPLADALTDLPKGDLILIPWEKENTKSIRVAFSSQTNIALFIGPEGGWDAREVELAVRHGAIPVRLGPTLLRSETAGLVAATLVLSECGVYS